MLASGCRKVTYISTVGNTRLLEAQQREGGKGRRKGGGGREEEGRRKGGGRKVGGFTLNRYFSLDSIGGTIF